ncbi:hypothetical protein FDENT_13955 [Fusarium denticulatum]|uniref:Uncharacterized protein n=1 Tax=Fusarium denticulatum TaxID=48507 RepID=A0A8H5SY85_9HYPO|nr:hypothetical protein FDENT_13955 [Fusarium denticulatum]
MLPCQASFFLRTLKRNGIINGYRDVIADFLTYSLHHVRSQIRHFDDRWVIYTIFWDIPETTSPSKIRLKVTKSLRDFETSTSKCLYHALLELSTWPYFCLKFEACSTRPQIRWLQSSHDSSALHLFHGKRSQNDIPEISHWPPAGSPPKRVAITFDEVYQGVSQYPRRLNPNCGFFMKTLFAESKVAEYIQQTVLGSAAPWIHVTYSTRSTCSPQPGPVRHSASLDAAHKYHAGEPRDDQFIWIKETSLVRQKQQ